MKKIATLVMLLIVGSISFAYPQLGSTSDEQEILVWTWHKAQRFSGIQSKQADERLKNLPIFLLTTEELSKEACPDDPQNCQGLAALYDTSQIRILLREDLNPTKGNIEISF